MKQFIQFLLLKNDDLLKRETSYRAIFRIALQVLLFGYIFISGYKLVFIGIGIGLFVMLYLTNGYIKKRDKDTIVANVMVYERNHAYAVVSSAIFSVLVILFCFWFTYQYYAMALNDLVTAFQVLAATIVGLFLIISLVNNQKPLPTRSVFIQKGALKFSDGNWVYYVMMDVLVGVRISKEEISFKDIDGRVDRLTGYGMTGEQIEAVNSMLVNNMPHVKIQIQSLEEIV